MVELEVISHISKQLNDFTTNFFALWNDADPVAWSLIKTYKNETLNYLCDLYYYIIIKPSGTRPLSAIHTRPHANS